MFTLHRWHNRLSPGTTAVLLLESLIGWNVAGKRKEIIAARLLVNILLFLPCCFLQTAVLFSWFKNDANTSIIVLPFYLELISWTQFEISQTLILIGIFRLTLVLEGITVWYLKSKQRTRCHAGERLLLWELIWF